MYSHYDSADTLLRADINPPSINSSKSFKVATRQRRIMYWLQVLFTIILIVLIALFFTYHEAILDWMESYIQLLRDEGIFSRQFYIFLLVIYQYVLLYHKLY